MDWTELSGRATVYTFTVVNGYPGLPDITLVPVVVDLPDAPGARLVSNVIDVDPADVAIGTDLIVDFHPIADGWLLPVFRVGGPDREGAVKRERPAWRTTRGERARREAVGVLHQHASTGGDHDGQAIVPEGDHYKCWCSCGEWQVEAPTEAEGLHLARVHTGSVPA